MKLFSIIFSSYLLVLSCLPCGDTQDCKILDKGKETFAETNHHNHREDSESCSPFCTCACCGSNFGFNFQCSVLITDNTPSLFPQRKRIMVENDAFASNFYGNIWQPPKI